ncbi:acyltransferase family protein [Streptomyces sp. TS71-3]|uniref:acyltransferase family protein n=1 Tax=Streptomyces sp. TS71-3 TaxID=2733862 RepID=UPI001B0A9E2C|nr:acyltransferase family protein [Streptomyces sp. TS71-3]GHJ41312.1 membrane protein [Streptomyces sp. TS71-3]
MRETLSPHANQDAQTHPHAGPGRPDGAVTERHRPRGSKQRDPFFDNAKYLAIVLVAMGHSWEPLREGSRTVSALYMTVYAFHMPTFIVISGYFSRSFTGSAAQLRRLLTGVALPYVIFEVAFSLFDRWAGGNPDQPISLLDPWFLTWFLAALFIWRLTTPLWKSLRWPLPIALAVAMLATTSPSIGDDLDLQRVLQFLPYFVLGLCLKPEHFQFVRRRAARILSVPVFACALATAYWGVPRVSDAWFFHRDSAEELGAPGWSGPVMTLALFGCSTVLVACFLAWVPGRRVWFSALGAGTLYGYLLHGFVAKAAEFWNWYDHDWLHGPIGEIAVTLVAAVVVTGLCTAPVRRIFRFALEPRMAWAFREDPAEAARARNTAHV